MALVMFARAPAPPLLLPSPNPPPCALPQDLTSLVSPSEPPDPPDPPDYLVGASNSFLSILLLRSSDLGSDLVQALSPLDLGFALRSITAVCSSWYQVFPLACLELWFSIPHLSHPLVTLSKGFVSLKGSNFFEFFTFFWNMPSFILQFPHHEDVMISTSFRLVLPQYEAVMILLKLKLFLPHYEDVLFSIGLRIQLLLPQYEVGLILYKLRLLLPHYEDVIQKLWLRAIHVIVSLVWFLEISRRIKEKTYDVLTRNDLGSWTPDLFIEKWWFSQPHTSPKLRFFSHLVGSRSWCFVAYAIVAVFHDAFYPLEDVASPDSRSPCVLSYFRKLISCFSTIGVFNFSCLTVMYASIFFFRAFRMPFVAVVSLAFVASLMYLLNHFSIVGE
ncbi:putative transmembrane protein [Arabidopsis thaliana]